MNINQQIILLKSSHQEVFCKKRCSEKLCNIHTKTPALESLFQKYRNLDLPFAYLKKEHDSSINKMRVKWFVMLLVSNISDTFRSSLRNGVLYVLVRVACLLGWCTSVGGVDDVLAWVAC